MIILAHGGKGLTITHTHSLTHTLALTHARGHKNPCVSVFFCHSSCTWKEKRYMYIIVIQLRPVAGRILIWRTQNVEMDRNQKNDGNEREIIWK